MTRLETQGRVGGINTKETPNTLPGSDRRRRFSSTLSFYPLHKLDVGTTLFVEEETEAQRGPALSQAAGLQIRSLGTGLAPNSARAALSPCLRGSRSAARRLSFLPSSSRAPQGSPRAVLGAGCRSWGEEGEREGAPARAGSAGGRYHGGMNGRGESGGAGGAGSGVREEEVEDAGVGGGGGEEPPLPPPPPPPAQRARPGLQPSAPSVAPRPRRGIDN